MRKSESLTASSTTRCLAFAALLLSFATARATDYWQDYWHYSYHGIDVTAAGMPQYAINLAHNMHRLDTAIVTVLPLDLGDWRPRTFIYAVPPDDMNKLLGTNADGGTAFTANGFMNKVVMDNTTNNQVHYWQAYYGYAGSLLTSEGKLRYPEWFRLGVSKVFAVTVISGDQVAVGGNAYAAREIDVLLKKPLIPMRDFLRLRRADPQLRVKDAGYRYEAQCWLLAHLIMIDRLFAKEFTSYLHLVSEGQGEDAAFAASFTISYEDVDQAIVAAWRAGRIHTLVMTIPDEPVKAPPVRLSSAAAKGRIAELATANDRSRDYGLKLVSEALAVDPAEEHALRALALAQTRREQYGDALATLDKLAANNSLSAGGDAVSGDLLIAIARAIRDKKAVLPADPTVLAQRAYDDYRRAIALVAEDLDYWASLADALGEEHDVTGAKEFLPKVEQVFYLHPRNSALASHIAYLCSNTGHYDDAIKFAVAWKANAITIQTREAAVAFLSRVQADKERQNLLQPGTATQGTSQ